MLSRGLRWVIEAEAAIGHRTSETVRVLGDADTAALERACQRDPVGNCYVQSVLDSGRQAGPLRHLHQGLFLGIDDLDRPGELLAACWVGSNVVPVNADWLAGELFGLAVVCLRRRLGSIFGPREAVMSIWSTVQDGPQRARSIREHQPLMVANRSPQVPRNPRVRPAQAEDLSQVLPASVAMFTEELGYSPMDEGPVGYQHRVLSLISQGHTLVEIGAGAAGENTGVVFKADIGIYTDQCVQLQGVWVAPEARGQRRAVPSVASVVDYALQMVPRVSLYVNNFNTAAVRTYESVGFDTVGEFATVLF